MKKFISLLCSLVVVIACFIIPSQVWAAEFGGFGEQILVSETVRQLEDGSKIITSVYEEAVLARNNLYNKTGSKTDRYVGAGGDVLWSITVHGEFRVLEGASVTCISASCSTEIFDEAWVCTRKYAETSGSWAIAYGEFERSLLGIVIDRDTVEVSLTCDVYGNLS